MTSTRTGVDVLDGDLEAVEGAGLGSKENDGEGIVSRGRAGARSPAAGKKRSTRGVRGRTPGRCV